MSAYQDYMLTLDPEIYLPLEETAATPLVNIGTLGTDVVGAHNATIEQQPTIIVRENFSMRYDDNGVTDGSVITAPVLLNTVVFVIRPTDLDEFILHISNSLVTDSYINIYLVTGELIIETVNGTINTGIIGTIGGITHVSLVYTGTFVLIYGNGVLIKNENVSFTTDLFDTFSFSEIVFLCTNDLTTEGGDVFTDELNNELSILCATETDEDCALVTADEDLLVTVDQDFLLADCASIFYLTDTDAVTQEIDENGNFLEEGNG